MRVAVLGGGRVGSAIARDLAVRDGWRVLVADAARPALDRLSEAHGIATLEIDLSQPDGVARAVSGADLVVVATPGPLGHATLRAVIDAGLPVVDVSFSEEDPFALQDLAMARGVVAAVDCGVAPGLSNLILGHAESAFGRLESFTCMVGGLPEVRRLPWEYRTVFSPIDVIAEYTRPARLVEGGRVVTREALSGIESIEVEGLGTLEAFNTDGLRTLLATVKVPNMCEKTLRYPGHAERIRLLRNAGFLSERPLEVGGAWVRPIDLTTGLLARAWEPETNDPDLTVMRIEVVGVSHGARVRQRWSLLDRFDPETGISSMARTTGYTCAAVVCALAEGRYREPGITPPEILGRDDGCFSFIQGYLAARGITLAQIVEPAS